MAQQGGELILVTNRSQLETMSVLVRSPHLRALDLNSEDAVQILPVDEDIQDALHVGSNERVIPSGCFLHTALVHTIATAVKRNTVHDPSQDKVGKLSARDLFSIFSHDVEKNPIHLAQSRNRYYAYSINHMELDRFVAHDVAEQLMLFKRDSGAGYTVLEDFFRYCREKDFLGDAVLSMMIFKAYQKKDRAAIVQKFDVSERVYAQVAHLFDRNVTERIAMDRKAETLRALDIKEGGKQGSLDTAFLGVTHQVVSRAVVFAFLSLKSEMSNRLNVSYFHDLPEKTEREEQVAIAIDEITADSDQDPAEYLYLGSVSVSNPFVPHKRPWMHSSDLTPESILSEIMQYYHS